jgi:hypothetical protein
MQVDVNFLQVSGTMVSWTCAWDLGKNSANTANQTTNNCGRSKILRIKYNSTDTWVSLRTRK